jgi:hypothetical protein
MGICDNPFHSFGGMGKDNYGDMEQSSCLRQGIWNYSNISLSSQLMSYVLSTFQSYKLYKQVKGKNIHFHTIIFIGSAQNASIFCDEPIIKAYHEQNKIASS